MRGFIFPIALLAATALPTDALGARAWQPPIPAPAGFTFGGLGPAVQIDAQGDVSTTLKPVSTGVYQYAVRPHAGALGAPQLFPGTLGEAGIETRYTAQNAAGDLLMWNSAGNVIGFRPAPIHSVAFGPASFTKVQSLAASTGALKYASMTPSGETFALALEGNPKEVNPTSQTYVIFRPAGPDTAFDESRKIQLQPAATDTATEPLGIVADPDGRVTAVYRSRPSLQVLQISAGPGGSFENPAQLTLTEDPAKWQESAVPKIATSYDGHAILVWGTDRSREKAYKTEIWASRRPPGGVFGPRERVIDLDPGHYETDVDSDYGSIAVSGANPEMFPVALDSGATLVAFNQLTEGDPCTVPETPDYKSRAMLVARDAGAWLATVLGSNGHLNSSHVDTIAGAGNSVAMVTEEVSRKNPCGAFSVADSVRVWQGSAPGPPVEIGNSGGSRGTGIAVNPAGDAALVLGWTRVLQVYEDPNAPPEPEAPTDSGGGSTAPDPPAPPTTQPSAEKSPPRAGPLGGVNLKRPLIVEQRGSRHWFNFSIFCASTTQIACTVTASASALAAKKAPALIKPASGKVAPGKTKALRTYLTPAGVALLKQKASFRTKVQIITRSGPAESSEVRTITVKQG